VITGDIPSTAPSWWRSTHLPQPSAPLRVALRAALSTPVRLKRWDATVRKRTRPLCNEHQPPHSLSRMCGVLARQEVPGAIDPADR